MTNRYSGSIEGCESVIVYVAPDIDARNRKDDENLL